MKFLTFIFTFLISLTLLAQTSFESGTDQIQVGVPSSGNNPEFVFDTGDGSGNKKISVDITTKEATLNTDLNVTGESTLETLSVESTSTHKDGIVLGDGVDANKSITVDKGGSNPYLKWDSVKQKWVFSNDALVEKAIGAGSGGGGTGQTFNENGNLEDGFNVSHNYSSGVASEAAGTNALEGEKSVIIDFSTQNEFYRSSFFTLPEGLYGAACEMRFKYTGGDGNTYVKIETESGITLGQYQRPESGSITYGLPAHVESGYESVYFKCPTTADVALDPLNGKIRYHLFQGTTTDAASFKADLFSMGELIGLTEMTIPDLMSAVIAATGSTYSESNPDFINGNCTNSGTGAYSCPFVSGLYSTVPSCSVSSRDGAGLREASILAITTSSISYNTYIPPAGTAMNAAVSIICEKQGVDAKQSVQVYKAIPKIAENINDDSIIVAAAGTLAFPSNLFVSSCSKISTGYYTCLFNPSIFTTSPAVKVSAGPYSSPTCTNAKVADWSTSFFSVETRNGSGALADCAFTAEISKIGNDLKLPTIKPVIIGQVTNSVAESALNNVRTEACRIDNAGAASLSSTSGLCNGWIQSVARTGSGIVDVTFKSGIFSSAPVCNVNSDDAAITKLCKQLGGTTPSGVTFGCSTSGTTTYIDSHFSISCTGKR